MCKCWFRALHLFLYSLAVYTPLSDSSDAALSPLVYRAPSRACARTQRKPVRISYSSATRRSSRAIWVKPYTYRRAAALSVSVRHSHGHRARSLGLSLARAARPARAVRVAPLCHSAVRCGSVARCVCVGACVCVETKLKL